MYRKIFHDGCIFLKKYWLFALVIIVINTAIGYSFVWLDLLGVFTVQPSQRFWVQLLFMFTIFPLSLGVIKCLDCANCDGRKNIFHLFYFYNKFERLGKALLLGVLIESLLTLLGKVFQSWQSMPTWAVACWSFCVLILRLYLFLASYIIVKDPTLGMVQIIKNSFRKIKGAINQLLFIHITLAILYFVMASFVSYIVRPLSLDDTWINLVNFFTQVISGFVSGIILYCCADNLLTQSLQGEILYDRMSSFTEKIMKGERQMREDYDEEELNDEDIEYDENAEYDEDVDIEGYDSSQFDADTLRNYRLFSDYEVIDSQTIEYDVSLQKLEGNVGEVLCDNEQIYFFLKDDSAIKRLFEKIYKQAKFEYQSYVDDSRTGVSYDVVTVNSNRVGLEVSISKVSDDCGYIIHVSLKINLD